MLSKQLLRRTVDEIHLASGVDLAVADLEGSVLVSAGVDPLDEITESLRRFAGSETVRQETEEGCFLRITDQNEPVFCAAAYGGPYKMETVVFLGKMIGILLEQERDGIERDDFYRKLLTDTILPTEAHGWACELGIRQEMPRRVYAVMIPEGKGVAFTDRLYRRLKMNVSGDVLMVDRRKLAVIRGVSGNISAERRLLERLEGEIRRCLESFRGARVRIGAGCRAAGLNELSYSWQEAVRAAEIGRQFGRGEIVHRFEDLLLEQLISQMPRGVCRHFLDRIAGAGIFDKFDREMFRMAAAFLDNTMNASETSRQLFFHRNTLRYKLSRIRLISGLDLRNFRDASLFRVGMMMHQYIHAEDQGT